MTPDPTASTPDALDRTEFLARVHGDAVLAGAMAALFIQEAPAQLEAVRLAVATGSAERVSQAAHLLRGSVANFSAGEAVSAALHLEQMGRTGELTDASDALIALERAIERLIAALREFTE